MKHRSSNKASTLSLTLPNTNAHELDGGQGKHKSYGALKRVYHRLGFQAPRWMARKRTRNGHISDQGCDTKVTASISAFSDIHVSTLRNLLVIVCLVIFLWKRSSGPSSSSLWQRRMLSKNRPFPFYTEKPIEIGFDPIDYSDPWLSIQHDWNYKPDYGGINMDPLEEGQAREVLFYPGEDGSEADKDENDSKHYDKYYSFDDDYFRNPYLRERDKKGQRCRRTSWHRLHKPNCNVIHELSWMDDIDANINEGYYRKIFDVILENPTPKGEIIALKALVSERGYDYESAESIRIDALVMERFTSNPFFVDIYGHCATSIITEYMAGDNVEMLAIPTSGTITNGRSDEKYDVVPLNDFTNEEKLDIALQMAESIAALHGYKDGVIVHDDIQLSQFIYNDKGQMKFGDFNRAEIMLWDEENKEYCRYRNGVGPGNYRSYEEYWDYPLNEKIDVLSFGNNIYALLTGLWIYFDHDDDAYAVKNVKHGKLPFIDERYRRRSFIESQLVQIMERCFVTKPDDRADIFEAVEFLRNAKKKHERLKATDPNYTP